MAYPAGVSLAVITTGSAGTFFGDDAKLEATVTPVLQGTPHIVHAATGAVLIPSPMVFPAQDGSGVSFSVPHTDQDGWLDGAGNSFKGWAYRVVVTARVGGQVVSWSKNVAPVVGQALVDLDLVKSEAIGVPVSAPAPSVLSVAGLTGVVTAAALQAAGLGGGGGGGITIEPDPDVEGAYLIGGI